MQKDIQQAWFFTKSPKEVWEYLTKPDLIEQWLMKSDFQPVAGHKFRFTFEPKENSRYEGIVYCEVLEVIPFTKLSYSWQKNSANDNKPFHSVITWTLVPKGSGTELQLLHTGFTALEDVVAHDNGWNICHKQLEDLINTVKNDRTNT